MPGQVGENGQTVLFNWTPQWRLQMDDWGQLWPLKTPPIRFTLPLVYSMKTSTSSWAKVPEIGRMNEVIQRLQSLVAIHHLPMIQWVV